MEIWVRLGIAFIGQIARSFCRIPSVFALIQCPISLGGFEGCVDSSVRKEGMGGQVLAVYTLEGPLPTSPIRPTGRLTSPTSRVTRSLVLSLEARKCPAALRAPSEF